MEIEIILEETWSYTLYKQNDDLYLTAVCGRVAIFEITIKLNNEEIKNYEEKGKDFIVYLARQIQDYPDLFMNRKI